jgi:hypothetical protein
MRITDVRAKAHNVDTDLAAGAPVFRLDHDEDVAGLLAYFAGERSRRAVRIVIGGHDAGHLERRDVLDWFQARSMGLGDSDRASLMGHVPPASWRFHELECPVEGCREPPQFVATFDPARPPHCRAHPDQALRRRP